MPAKSCAVMAWLPLPGTGRGSFRHTTLMRARSIACTLLHALRQAGWRIALPVVLGRAQPLEFRLWLPDGTLVPGSFGIPVPCEGSTVVEPDVMFVPMLAFDRFGYRLGYGGGFYDRTLALARQDRAAAAIGVAYAAQQIDRCPTGDYDQPLDGIITQNGPVALVAAVQEG